MPQPTAGPFTAAITGLSHSITAIAAGVGSKRDPRAARSPLGGLAGHDLLHVVAGAEGRIGPGHDHAAHVRIGVGVAEGGLELGVGAGVQRVAPLRPVEGDAADVVAHLVEGAGEVLRRRWRPWASVSSWPACGLGAAKARLATGPDARSTRSDFREGNGRGGRPANRGRGAARTTASTKRRSRRGCPPTSRASSGPMRACASSTAAPRTRPSWSPPATAATCCARNRPASCWPAPTRSTANTG